MESGILKVYCRYVHGALVLVKKDQIEKIWNPFKT